MYISHIELGGEDRRKNVKKHTLLPDLSALPTEHTCILYTVHVGVIIFLIRQKFMYMYIYIHVYLYLYMALNSGSCTVSASLKCLSRPQCAMI